LLLGTTFGFEELKKGKFLPAITTARKSESMKQRATGVGTTFTCLEAFRVKDHCRRLPQQLIASHWGALEEASEYLADQELYTHGLQAGMRRIQTL
jgi:hypothetical protein